MPLTRLGLLMEVPVPAECEWSLDRAWMKHVSDFYILSQFTNRTKWQ